MELTSTLWYLGFSLAAGIGPVKCALLKERFGSIGSAYNASYPDLSTVLGTTLATQFTNVRASLNLPGLLKQFAKDGIYVAGMEDPGYPADLLAISDPPVCVYMKGNRELLLTPATHRLAIVGTRNPTSYGVQVTQQLSSGLSSLGWCIVSGLALGVDAVAHAAAVGAGGKTVAVLGCGVDLRYPPSNAALYDLILQQGGAIVSEFPPGMLVQKGMFVTRNRIISGLSRGVVVIEGRSTSGALITARYAGEQGKEVFATPAPITSPQSEAPNLLLKQGARLVTGVDDILDEFHMHREARSAAEAPELEADEGNLYALLKQEPLTADDIAVRSGIPVTVVLRMISSLEIKRIISKRDDGVYCVR